MAYRRVTPVIAMAFTMSSTMVVSAQPFPALVGTWQLDEHWLDSTLIFDAADEQVMLDYNFGRAKLFPTGTPLPDSATVINRVHASFQELKRYTLTIHTDSSFMRTGVDHHGPTGRSDSGIVALENDGWKLIERTKRGDHIPIVLSSERLEMRTTFSPVMRMLFRKAD